MPLFQVLCLPWPFAQSEWISEFVWTPHASLWSCYRSIFLGAATENTSSMSVFVLELVRCSHDRLQSLCKDFASAAPNGSNSSSLQCCWWLRPGWKGKQRLLFEVPHVEMIQAGFQRGNYLSLPSLTTTVLLRCLNCFNLGWAWQGVGFHLKGRLQVPAFPRARRPHWQGE